MVEDLERKAEAERVLREAIKNLDHEGCRRRVEWSLNEPLCCCQPCYDSWFEWGKELYVNMPEAYEERKAEALVHLESKRVGRKLNEEKRTKEMEARYSKKVFECSAA